MSGSSCLPALLAALAVAVLAWLSPCEQAAPMATDRACPVSGEVGCSYGKRPDGSAAVWLTYYDAGAVYVLDGPVVAEALSSGYQLLYLFEEEVACEP